MEPLYLVDGSGYIFRAYFAIAPLTNHHGLPTNALFGFTRMLTKLLRDMKAHYIAVTFDTGHPTFRHEMYTEYKANRDECPSDLVPQMPYFRKIVQAFGIPCLEKPGVEADDIIGTLAKLHAQANQDVVVVSGDKDLLQLVGDHVTVYDAMRDVYFDREGVKKKLGVFPEQVCDYLALIGDSSDNVPGVRGIGPKTAEKLLESFGSLERLLTNSNEIGALAGLRGAKGIQTKIESSLEEARLSYRLVSLSTDVEPFHELRDVNEFAFQSVRSDLIVPLFDELEFSNLLPSLEFAGASAAPAKLSADDEGKKYSIVSPETFSQFVEELSQQKTFAFDSETTSLDCLSCELIGLSFSWKRGTGHYIPVSGKSAEGRTIPLEEIRAKLGPIFADPTIRKIGLNLKFDVGVLEQQGIPVRGLFFDGMLAAHLINPDRRQLGLKYLAQVHLNEQMVTYDELTEGFESLGDVPLEKIARYASHDADASWGLFEELQKGLGEIAAEGPSVARLFHEVEMPLVSVLSRMERAGIKVDIPFLDALGQEFGGELSTLEKDIQTLAGKEFNVNSPKQLGVILFEDMKLPTKGVKKTQSGYSTDASVLSLLAAEHEIARKLLEYRELHKLNSTYVDALKRLANPKTSRIHSSFNQAIAATGRLSSTDPNLQNIPIRNPRGRRLRQAFIAEAGSVFIAADYSQIELRVLAHLSGDPGLSKAFQENEDIHTRTAKELFGAMLSGEELKNFRRIAKTINFGIVYGMGAFRLSNDLGVSRKQAQQYIDDYFARYPKVLEYFDRMKREIEEKGYVETLLGRRRYIREIDTSGRDSGFAERSLLNAPLQGTAAEIIKRAMIDLDAALAQYGDRARMVLQVHDELVLEVEESIAPEVQQLFVSTMESAVKLDVPLKVDVRSGTRWGE